VYLHEEKILHDYAPCTIWHRCKKAVLMLKRTDIQN